MGSKGIVASSAAMGILLQQGIGDTIRISLTPEPDGDRTREVQVAQELLQTMGFRQFVPIVAACPGCGRTTSTVFQELAQNIQADIRKNMPVWRENYPGVEDAEGRGDGLHRQRPGRIQARRHRHLAARHRRDAGRAGLHRRQEGGDAARPDDRRATSRSMVADYIEQRFGQAARPPRSRHGCAFGLRPHAVLLCWLRLTWPCQADPPGKGASPVTIGRICDLIEAACRAATSCRSDFFARLIWKESRFDPNARQPGRRRGHRPVHAGHRQDARPRQFLRHRPGDPGLGEISRRIEDAATAISASPQPPTMPAKAGSRAGCPPAASCRWRPRATCSTSWASRSTISPTPAYRRHGRSRSIRKTELLPTPAAGCR